MTAVFADVAPLSEEEEKALQNEEALVLLDAWGTGEKIDKEPFQGHAFVIRDYHPEWVDLPEHEGVVTLLSVNVGKLTNFEGYRLFGSYDSGEKECPYLSDPEHLKSCSLCRGDNYIYWGDEWRVVVLLALPENDDNSDDESEDE